MDTLWRECRLALRQCRRHPRFALAIVSTLALAIGANVAVFSVVDAVVLRALPFGAPDRLAWIASVRTDNPEAPFTLPEYVDYRAATRTMSGLSAYASWSANLTGEGITERLQGARMSANAFDVLALSPSSGRLLQESDDRADAPRVAVISFRLWQRQFGGAAEAVGRTVRINAESFTIVGVLPPEFFLPLRDVDVVVPLSPSRDPLRSARASVNFLRFFGRLAPGVSMDQAQGELTAICRSLRQQFPKEYARKESVRAIPMHEALVGSLRQPMLLLLGAVAVVLAAALANLLSLVLVRAAERRPELAVRVAIGASRWQLVRQLAVEALLLTLSGAALGIVMAAWGSTAAGRWAPASIPRLAEAGIDRRALVFTLTLTGLVAALLTMAPFVAVLRTRAGDALRLAARGSVGDRWNQRLRHALVVGEIAAALVLLLATTVLVGNVARLQRVEPGFDPDGVFEARVSLPPTYRSPEDLARFAERLSERIAALPGVTSVGLVSSAPLSGVLATVPFSIVGGTVAREEQRPNVNLRAITPGYLRAAGTRLTSGRAFAETDRPETLPVALVSAAFADRFLPGEPIGRRILIDDNNTGPRPVDVVGIVENVRQTTLEGPPALDVYIPLKQIHQDGVTLLRNNQFWMVRTRTDPAAVRTSFVSSLGDADRDAAVSDTGPMRQSLESWLGPRRFSLGLLAAFSMTAVLLAVSGLYGFVSYTVSQRRAEIGLRMAIGATERDVRGMILRQATRLGLAGAAIGLCLSGVVRPLAGLFGQEASVDPVVAGTTAGCLVAMVMVAAWLPARRAARIHPSAVLKGD